MNIFATNECPKICAQEHCDVHLVKMILETAQLLSTAHVVLDGVQVAYKKTHQNHPSAIWVRESVGNYTWTFRLLEELIEEYQFRTGKTHKTKQHLKCLTVPPENIPDGQRTPFSMAMPEEHKVVSVFHGPCAAYHSYLNQKFKEWQSREDKRPIFAKWSNRQMPTWANF